MEKQTNNLSKKFFIITWLCALLLGFGGLSWYKTRPGEMTLSLSEWPSQAGLHLSNADYTMVLFLHPKCECSDATVYELASLLKDAGTKLKTQIVFYYPEKAKEEWAHTDLWSKASAFQNSTLIADKAGKTAFLFGARTSGETYLFNSTGKLLFHGGITESRGHIGPSPGQRAVASILEGTKSSDFTTKPFGCSLFSAEEFERLSKDSNASKM